MKEEKVETIPQGSENEEILKLYKENVDLKKDIETYSRKNNDYYNKCIRLENKVYDLERDCKKAKDNIVPIFFIGLTLGCLISLLVLDDYHYTIRPKFGDTKVIRIEKYSSNLDFVDYYIDKGDSICFRDSVGKFTIGDVIKFTK